ncbi:putative cytochrome P450 [Aspergillus heteromorphus CBS 117.55]|uniref:Putative cytochrome P450 n=1 Tax=Aspergillus heteromorphus CBS 117.55 TaxID=1448321 RepID=A0A317WU52_9EURO|nr:putative cytochrome P450 [Aspergillus heteromorphus CBS 117.55]PWY89944.1 putative cytochrome P450 [Aspergillus heteromorphus CBS 117.55]
MLSLAAFILLTLTLTWYYHQRSSSQRLPLPPGPTLLSAPWPENDIARTFHSWNKRYGPVVSVKIGFRTIIILGTRQAAQDLLERRGTIYSSRPTSIFMDRYLNKGLNPAFMQYGPNWRLHRRFYSTLLNMKASQTYRRLQDIGSKELVHELLSTNDFSEVFYRYTSDVMLRLVYGKGRDWNDADHRRLQQINEMATFILQNASFRTTLLDLFPVLDKLPMQFMKWRQEAAQLHDKTREVYVECANSALQEQSWNWIQEIQERPESKDIPWEDVSYSLGELYVAGIYTTKMVLETFVTTCVDHMDVVRKAQNELDSVVGTERLPNFGDMDRLLFVGAFISELVRWKPISPIGVPHAVIQDDEYLGFRIPKDATIIANQWGINMDEAVFDAPETFRPERYMDNPDRHLPGFGFGRRACPGYHLAKASFFIVISRVLWAYHIERGGPTGDDAKGDCDSRRIVFTVRSLQHREVIERERKMCENDVKEILEEIRPPKC